MNKTTAEIAKPQWALYNGVTYKILKEISVNLAPGYLLATAHSQGLAVEKSWVEAY